MDYTPIELRLSARKRLDLIDKVALSIVAVLMPVVLLWIVLSQGNAGESACYGAMFDVFIVAGAIWVPAKLVKRIFSL